MIEDATTRFSARVGNYVRYRPGYPGEVIELLQRECSLGPDSRVADIGSGTGLLSIPFLNAGYSVTGIEPNSDMREASEATLAGIKLFHAIDARAEATTLPEASIDLCVAGQAFHWFDVEKAKREWKRILRPGGSAALIWNERLREGPFMTAVENVIDRFAAARDKDGEIRNMGKERIEGFFAPAPVLVTEFPNEQEFDLAGLHGRVFSASYLPLEGDPESAILKDELAKVFEAHQTAGKIRFLYRTKVYVGVLN